MKNHTQQAFLEMREERPKARGVIRHMFARKDRRESKQELRERAREYRTA